MVPLTPVPWPVLGSGSARGVDWVVTGVVDPVGEDGEGEPCLNVEVSVRRAGGGPDVGGGFGGAPLVTADEPIQWHMRRNGYGVDVPDTYAGQVVKDAERVELTYVDGSVDDAALIVAALPVNVWIGFSRGSVRVTSVRAFDAAGRQLGSVSTVFGDL